VALLPMGFSCSFVAEIEPFPCYVLHHRLGASRPRVMPDPDDVRLEAVAAGKKPSAVSRAYKTALANIGLVQQLPARGRIPNAGDFTTIREDDYEPIDLLVGGTPCQDFSIAGLGAGLSGRRGDLTLKFLELAARLRPRWVLWENVPNVLSIHGGRPFGTFLGGLEKLGYGWAYRTMDARTLSGPNAARRRRAADLPAGERLRRSRDREADPDPGRPAVCWRRQRLLARGHRLDGPADHAGGKPAGERAMKRETLTLEEGRRLLQSGNPQRTPVRAKRAYRCPDCGATRPESEVATAFPCRACKSKAKPLHFPSKTEAKRYDDLRLMQQAGEIRDLELQPSYRLSAGGVELGWCRLDFRYRDHKTGKVVVEDAKGRAGDTPISRWKRRHVEAEHKVLVILVGG